MRPYTYIRKPYTRSAEARKATRRALKKQDRNRAARYERHENRNEKTGLHRATLHDL